jgi:AcrR family transcriptional regulator
MPVSPPTATDPKDSRGRIAAALIDLVSTGERINHDLVAERAGISRRTLYRYFPDRDSLMQEVGDEIRRRAGAGVRFPQSEDDLLATLHPIHEGFDAIAPIATLVRSTPIGRQVRLADKQRRQAAYTAAAADAVQALPERDRRLATAMLQFLHTSAWLEMRDQWDLTGSDVADVSDWAIRTLLADLRRRGATPLAAGPAEPGTSRSSIP